MKKLRYSDIVGSYFYNIELTEGDRDLVDTFFTAGGHHLKRYHEATSDLDRYFHLSRHRAHLRRMMMIIFLRGDFQRAKDESNRDLDRRETWDPRFTTMPDNNMWNKWLPDFRYPIGVEHCGDKYLLMEDLIHIFNA